jgi:hypothetical protein
VQAHSDARDGVAAESPFALVPSRALLHRVTQFDDEPHTARAILDENAPIVDAVAQRLAHRPAGLWLVDAASDGARRAEDAPSAELAEVAAEARRHAADAVRLLTELPPGVFAGASRKLRARVITDVRGFGWTLADDPQSTRAHRTFCRAYDDLAVIPERPEAVSVPFAGLTSLTADDRLWLAPDAQLATSGWFDDKSLAEVVSEPGGRLSVRLELRVTAAKLMKLRHASEGQRASVAERELDVLYLAANLLQSVRGPLAIDATHELLGPQAWWASVDPQSARIVRCVPLRMDGGALVATVDELPGRELVHAIVAEPIDGSFSGWARGDALATPTTAVDANARFLLAAVAQQPDSHLAERLLGLLDCVMQARGSSAYATAVVARRTDRDPGGLMYPEGWHDTLGTALLDRCLRYRAVTAATLDAVARATVSDGGVALAATLSEIALVDDAIERSW